MYPFTFDVFIFDIFQDISNQFLSKDIWKWGDNVYIISGTQTYIYLVIFSSTYIMLFESNFILIYLKLLLTIKDA